MKLWMNERILIIPRIEPGKGIYRVSNIISESVLLWIAILETNQKIFKKVKIIQKNCISRPNIKMCVFQSSILKILQHDMERHVYQNYRKSFVLFCIFLIQLLKRKKI